jgi:hypothetical protein
LYSRHTRQLQREGVRSFYPKRAWDLCGMCPVIQVTLYMGWRLIFDYNSYTEVRNFLIRRETAQFSRKNLNLHSYLVDWNLQTS